MVTLAKIDTTKAAYLSFRKQCELNLIEARRPWEDACLKAIAAATTAEQAKKICRRAPLGPIKDRTLEHWARLCTSVKELRLVMKMSYPSDLRYIGRWWDGNLEDIPPHPAFIRWHELLAHAIETPLNQEQAVRTYQDFDRNRWGRFGLRHAHTIMLPGDFEEIMGRKWVENIRSLHDFARIRRSIVASTKWGWWPGIPGLKPLLIERYQELSGEPAPDWLLNAKMQE